MDKLKKENQNFELFREYINNLSNDEAKEFIIEFFQKYKYLLSNDISRVMDDDLLKIVEITEAKKILKKV